MFSRLKRQVYSLVVMVLFCCSKQSVSSLSRSYGKIDNLQTIIAEIDHLNKSLQIFSQHFLQLELGQKYKWTPLALNYNFNDCASLYEDGYTQSGVYNIWLTTGYRFLPIYCDMETRHPDTNKRGWMVIQRRYNGELNFNRTWQEYVDGFGSPHGEYWIGLENIYQLAGYTRKMFDDKRSLKLVLTDHSGNNIEVDYQSFEIMNSTNLYMLAEPFMRSSIEFLEDGFSISRWRKFTTIDNNNQNKKGPENCAQASGGGWWFDSGCSWANLNARYPRKNEKMSKSTIFWKDWGEIYPSNDALTNVSMKIQ